MKWHLVSPDGGIVRSTDADSIGEARFRLRPILPNHRVLSNDSVQLGYEMGVTKQTLSKTGYKRTHFEQAHWSVLETRRKLLLAANVENISDAAIGREFGVTGEAVSQMRKTLGLPTVAERKRMAIRAYWTLGWPDRRIGARIGMDAPHVTAARRRMGLAAHRTKGGLSKQVRATIIGGDYHVG